MENDFLLYADQVYNEIKWELQACSVEFKWETGSTPLNDRKIYGNWVFMGLVITLFVDKNNGDIWVGLSKIAKIHITSPNKSVNDVKHIFDIRFKKWVK